MKVKGYQLKSSNIACIGYDRLREKLYVQFKKDDSAISIYSYENCSMSTFDDFLSADSPGTYFSSNIRNNPSMPSKKVQTNSLSDVFDDFAPATEYASNPIQPISIPTANLAWCW